MSVSRKLKQRVKNWVEQLSMSGTLNKLDISYDKRSDTGITYNKITGDDYELERFVQAIQDRIKKKNYHVVYQCEGGDCFSHIEYGEWILVRMCPKCGSSNLRMLPNGSQKVKVNEMNYYEKSFLEFKKEHGANTVHEYFKIL